MAQWLGVAGRLFALELSEGGPKLSLTDGRKQQLDGFSSCCKAEPLEGPPREKWNFANKVYYAGSNSQRLSAGSQNFPDRPRLTGSLLQINCDGIDVWMLVCFFL